MVFQDPMTSLNPTMTIGKQIMEGIIWHFKTPKDEARRQAISLLKEVGIDDAEKRMKNYPHQLSGGMRQRVVIAIALACNPDLLICDEPTTALDVTIQAQVVNLMKDIQQETGTAYLFIAHDLSMVKYISDRIGVLHLGHLLETGTTDEIFSNPVHPYTKSLLSAIPESRRGEAARGAELRLQDLGHRLREGHLSPTRRHALREVHRRGIRGVELRA